MNKHQSKIRLLKSSESTLPWQTYIPRRGWKTMGHLKNAILNRCKFENQSSKYLYCDAFHDVSTPMKKSVELFGIPINQSGSTFECGGIPIKACDQVIIMNGRLFKIA